jgi:hypothetical protein
MEQTPLRTQAMVFIKLRIGPDCGLDTRNTGREGLKQWIKRNKCFP